MKATRARLIVAAALFSLCATGCAANSGPVSLAVVGSAQQPVPGGVLVGAAALPKASGASSDCGDPTASLRPPGPLPAPGQMPAGSTMAAIQQRGYLIAGVDQNTNLFGYRDPRDNQLKGFDIDMIHAVAKAIFGDPDKVRFAAISSAQRIPALTGQGPQVDIVARTFTITCARKQQVAFSSVYYLAQRRVLVTKGSPITGVADLGGKRVCATIGSDSLSTGQGKPNPPIPVAVYDWSDCLVMLQQGEVDAVSTDDTILAGMVAQDPNTQIVGASITPEPYGLAMPRKDEDFVRFVNGVLEQIRADGTWANSYNTWLAGPVGGSPTPPPATYSD
jgi:polar amino acid transport system substrate-binding protein